MENDDHEEEGGGGRSSNSQTNTKNKKYLRYICHTAIHNSSYRVGALFH